MTNINGTLSKVCAVAGVAEGLGVALAPLFAIQGTQHEFET
jgi:hypothetical protein